MGITNLATKTGNALGKAAGAFVGGTAAIATNVAVGVGNMAIRTIGSTAKGIGSGAGWAVKNLTAKPIKEGVKQATEVISEAASSGAKAIEEAGEEIGKKAKALGQNVQDAAVDAVEKGKKGLDKAGSAIKEAASSGKSDVVEDAISFVGADGSTYERTKNPKWVEGSRRKSNGGQRNQYLYTKDGQGISGKQFGQAHIEAESIAENISQTGAGEHAGINFGSFGDFVGNHPGLAIGGAVGAGFLANELFDD